jgi:hypothetical protein
MKLSNLNRLNFLTIVLALRFMPLQAYPVPAGGQAYVHALSGLRLRDSASETGAVVATIPYGEKIKILSNESRIDTLYGLQGSWSKVEWNQKSGYVFNGFLSRYPLLKKDYDWDLYFKESKIPFKEETIDLQGTGVNKTIYTLENISVEEVFFMLRSNNFYKETLKSIDLQKKSQHVVNSKNNFTVDCSVTRNSQGQIELIDVQIQTGGDENYTIKRIDNNKTEFSSVMVEP